MPGPNASQTETNKGSGDTRKQIVELMSLGGRINATHRKISKTAGTAPRMVSDAIRDDLLDAIVHFVSKVCAVHVQLGSSINIQRAGEEGRGVFLVEG